MSHGLPELADPMKAYSAEVTCCPVLTVSKTVELQEFDRRMKQKVIQAKGGVISARKDRLKADDPSERSFLQCTSMFLLTRGGSQEISQQKSTRDEYRRLKREVKEGLASRKRC